MRRNAINLLLALALAAALSACSAPDQTESGPAPTGGAPQDSQAVQTEPDGYVFTAPNGGTVAMGDDMAAVLKALGEAQTYFEAPSCAFEGLDKTYTYSGFTILTRPDGDRDLVNSILLTDDSAATPEGVFIGSSAQDVAATYGEPAQQTDTMLGYVKGGTALNFILEDGRVISIEYLPCS